MFLLKKQTIHYPNINRLNTPITYLIFFLIFFLFISIDSNAQDSLSFKKLYYDNGSLSSEGYMNNGVPEGYWKSYYENGKLFSEGNRKDGMLDGNWQFYNTKGKLKEEINFEKDKKEGFSRIYYPNGTVKEKIPYKSGLKQGVAEYYFNDGNLEQKMPFEKNLRQGRSYTYNQDDGRIIILEEYIDDKLAEQLYINRYNSDSLKSNLWIEFHPNEKKRLEGKYEDGKKQGIFKEYDVDENLIAIYNYNDGELANTSKNVQFLEIEKNYYNNGKLKSAISKDKQGLKQGYTYFYDSLGRLTDAKFYDRDTILFTGITDSLGRKQKEWVYYYRNGNKKAEGIFINDKEDGPWRYYFEDGTLEQSGDYALGKALGTWRWYFFGGKDRRIENYENGLLNGDYLEYDPYGYITAEGQYQDGYKNGKWFLSYGDQVEQGKFRDGLKQGQWEYFKYELSEEAKYFVGEFYQGLPDGDWNIYNTDGKLIQVLSFNKGSKEGIQKTYSASGQILREAEYKSGELINLNGLPFKIDEK